MDKANDRDIGVTRGILIDAANKVVSEVEIPNGVNIASVIGCEWITHVNVSEGSGKWAGFGEDLWLDDEGLLVQPNPYGYFKLVSEINGAETALFAGNGLIVGYDNQGERVSSKLTVDEVQATVRWIAYEDTNPEELEPAITVTPLDENFQPVPGAETRHPLAVRKPH